MLYISLFRKRSPRRSAPSVLRHKEVNPTNLMYQESHAGVAGKGAISATIARTHGKGFVSDAGSWTYFQKIARAQGRETGKGPAGTLYQLSGPSSSINNNSTWAPEPFIQWQLRTIYRHEQYRANRNHRVSKTCCD